MLRAVLTAVASMLVLALGTACTQRPVPVERMTVRLSSPDAAEPVHFAGQWFMAERQARQVHGRATPFDIEIPVGDFEAQFRPMFGGAVLRVQVYRGDRLVGEATTNAGTTMVVRRGTRVRIATL